MTQNTDKDIFSLLDEMIKFEIQFDFDTRENMQQGPDHFHNDHYDLFLMRSINNFLSVDLHFHKLGEESFQIIYENRFKYFECLESLIESYYQNVQNNDPCDYVYTLDTNHVSETWMLSVTCTDYFS